MFSNDIWAFLILSGKHSTNVIRNVFQVSGHRRLAAKVLNIYIYKYIYIYIFTAHAMEASCGHMQKKNLNKFYVLCEF